MKTEIDSKATLESKTQWARLRSASEEEIEAGARSDPDNPPLTGKELKKMRRVSFVKHLRHRLGMSQTTFSETFEISLSTLRDWEQHRYRPDQTARTFLKLIALIPDQVKAALASKEAKSLNELLARKK